MLKDLGKSVMFWEVFWTANNGGERSLVARIARGNPAAKIDDRSERIRLLKLLCWSWAKSVCVCGDIGAIAGIAVSKRDGVLVSLDWVHFFIDWLPLWCLSHLREGTAAILPHRCHKSTKDAVDESRKETADRVARYQADY